VPVYVFNFVIDERWQKARFLRIVYLITSRKLELYRYRGAASPYRWSA